MSRKVQMEDTMPNESARTFGGCPVVNHEYMIKGPPGQRWRELQEMQHAGPILRSSEGIGYWFVARHALILEVLQNPELFSSTAMLPQEPDPAYQWIPQMMDPPEQTVWRRFLAPVFSPGSTLALAPHVQERCVELVEQVADRGTTDLIADFASQFPTTIFLEMMGLPTNELEQFMDWAHQIMHMEPAEDPDRSIAFGAMQAVKSRFTHRLTELRATPELCGDDLISLSLDWRIDDAPIPEDQLLSFFLLMFMAGLDTVTAQLSYAFHHLATHPHDRRRIVADPSIIPKVVEELLRAHPLIQPSRKVMHDNNFHGYSLKKGDMVMCSLAFAGHDDTEYPDSLTVDIDRAVTRHLSFGAGPHRCLGSHLARRELVVALEEWHKRIPDYWIDDAAELSEHSGQVFGIETLPLRWSVAQ